MSAPEDTTQNQTQAIQVQEPLPGKAIATGLIGPWLIQYEIRLQDDGSALYYIDKTPVTREVYLDCLKTDDKDRFCHGCMGEDDEVCECHGGHEHEEFS